jgi:DNA-binding beta-propeller fold protein YncE
MLALAVGCATKPPPQAGYVFFPPAPDEPHLQYLTSFGAESDLHAPTKLEDILTGGRRTHHPIVKPYGVAVNDGKVYVCDTQLGAVEVVDLVKHRLDYFKAEGQGSIKQPINLAIDRDGTRYVTDTVRCQVLIYRKDGSFLAQLGKLGEMRPSGVVVTADRLFVSDLLHRCIRVYAKEDRRPLFTLPRQTNDAQGLLFAPTNLAVDQAGDIYVSDTGGFHVQIFNAEGKHLRTIGEMGLQYGQFALTKGIAVDRAGRIYVVDSATTVVQVFDAEGRLLTFFGEPKSSDRAALYLPAGLCVDYEHLKHFQQYVAPGYRLEHLIFVTNQAGPNKVSVYGYITKS